MTLLLVLSDEAEVVRDSQRLRSRARFCHLEGSENGRQGKAREARKAKARVLTRVWYYIFVLRAASVL
jgi:hypothetical protein